MNVKELLLFRKVLGSHGIWGKGYGSSLNWTQMQQSKIVLMHIRVRSNIIRSQLARMSSNFKP